MCIKTHLIRKEAFGVEWYLNSIEIMVFSKPGLGARKSGLAGGRQSPELDIRRIAKIFIQWN